MTTNLHFFLPDHTSFDYGAFMLVFFPLLALAVIVVFTADPIHYKLDLLLVDNKKEIKMNAGLDDKLNLILSILTKK